MTEQNIIKFLKKFTLFSGLDDKHLLDIYNLMKRNEYSAGTTLFFQGDPGEYVFFLRKGKIKALKSNPAGEEQILDILQPGDVFGEVVLFGIDEYPATAVAMQDVEVIFLSREKFKDYFYKNPDIGWGMLQEMALKLRRAQRKIENLGLRDTRGRVAALLIDLLFKFGDSKNKVYLDLNRQEMASFIGATRETVSRILSEFKNNGLISIDGNRIYINDMAGLKKLI
ncbi:MAG: Crp/Fnr family transcriptional regulator [Halanaerobiaceae bacterium]